MILHGDNLIIKLDGTAIAGAKSCRISVQAETIDTSSPSDGQWDTSIVGRKKWTVNTDHLIIAASSSDTPVKTAIGRVGQTYTLSFNCSDLASDTMSGSAHCVTFRVDAKKGSLMAGSFEFKGSGPLT